ncbi:MAG: lytic transglycosylase domain-containing protein [Acidimicrobiales bacterium]|nr:lytic transglycosylase domain-containing protein [Acidimicrobiales bacterium]
MSTRRSPAAVLLVAALAVGACAERAERNPVAARATTTSSTSTTAPTTTVTTAPPTTTIAAPVDVHGLRPPAPAGDPAGLAAQILAAETTLRDPAAKPEAVAAAALGQQVAYRQLGVHPEWDGAVLAAVPPELHYAVQHNAAARREFRAMHRTLATSLPSWRIVPPDPPDQLMAAYAEAGQVHGIPWSYLAAIHLVETGIGRIRGTSVAGAQGPMQFLPTTWAAYGNGGDINDTSDAIMAAARYLEANGGRTDLARALWNYNHSDHYVRGVTLYAELIGEHPQGFRAFYHWGIWYLTANGDVYLPVGYDGAAPAG